MTINAKILAIIPARGGSQGISGKNIKLLDGKPLIEYTINSAKKSKLIDTLILSSDDENIINTAKELELNVPFTRPKHLALDRSGSLEVVQHAIQFFENRNINFDAVILLQPTTPFREDGFIDSAIEKFCYEKCDSLISVQPVPHQYNPHWVFKTNEEDFLEISTGEKEIIKRRQDLPHAYYRDGSLYITKTETLKAGSFYGQRTNYITSSPQFHVNIDQEKDWKEAVSLVDDYLKAVGNG